MHKEAEVGLPHVQGTEVYTSIETLQMSLFGTVHIQSKNTLVQEKSTIQWVYKSKGNPEMQEKPLYN